MLARMKRMLFLFSDLLALAAVSCSVNDDDGEYYQYRLGIIEGSSDATFTILTDDGYRLKPTEFLSNDYEIVDGKRVIVQFSIVAEVESSEIDYEVKMAMIEDIPVKDIIIANEEVRDSLGTDPATISALSLGNGYLNVQFSFYGQKAEKHYLYMVYDEEKQEKEGFITLDFHHNAHDDIKSSPYSGLFSFPVAQFEEGGSGTIKFLFRSRKEDNSTFTHELEYKYGEVAEEEEN